MVALALLQPAWSHAITCEELRAQVQEKIRNAGVQDFDVSIVRADADVAGQVVGTCDQGAGKLIYTRPAPPVDPAAQATPPAEPSQPILTECRDGSVSMGGVCKP
jgi:hypothetical protein